MGLRQLTHERLDAVLSTSASRACSAGVECSAARPTGPGTEPVPPGRPENGTPICTPQGDAVDLAAESDLERSRDLGPCLASCPAGSACATTGCVL